MQPLLFDLISGRQQWLSRRQAVLTQNVANADTPRYEPLDLKPARAAELRRQGSGGGALGVGLARTASVHLAGDAPRAAEPRARQVDGFEPAPSGNAVVLDEQLQKLGETQLGYALATNLYRRHVGLLKTALGTAGA